MKTKDIKSTEKKTSSLDIAAEARKAGYLAYKAEMQRQASEIAADPKAYQARQEKRAKSEQERLSMLAEKRKARMEKLQRVELTQKQKTLKDLEHFKLAQERRNKKKLERRQMYLSKDGIQLPKVKNKKVKALKKKIIANANALADRILNKAIAKEEQQKAWETRKEELKAEAAKKRKEAALKKREEKAKKLIQIHTSIPTKDTSKKQKAIDKEIEKKHNEKMIAMETKFEDFNPKQQKLTKEERIERNKKRAIKLIHHKEIKDKIKHTTKEEREKVEIRPIVEQPKKQDSSKHRYIVRTQYIDQPSLTGDRVGAIVCLPDKLKDIVKYSFNKMMEKESDKVVGYFIYDSDNPEVCIMEMVNSKYREIDGVTITRLQKQDKTAA